MTDLAEDRAPMRYTWRNYFDVPHVQRSRWGNFLDWLLHPISYHRWRKQHIVGYRWVGNL